MKQTFKVLPQMYAVCRFSADQSVPAWAMGDFVSVTRTVNELSIVCPQDNVPTSIQREVNWRCLRVEGKLDFSMVGVIASLTGSLAAANITVLVISTFDTDYLLLKDDDLVAALKSLTDAGHSITTSSP